MELLGIEEEGEEESDSGSEEEDDEGLVAPKGLDQEADANEAAAKNKRRTEAKEENEDSD